MTRHRTSAQLICAELQEAGVEHVFGVPGSALVGIWEAVRREPRMRVVGSTSELMASFMANGYARASGRPAVLFTIAGPGLTYAVSGIAEALLDSVPVVHVVNAGAGVRPDGAPGLQAISQAEIMRPLVKEVIEVDAASDISDAMRAALALSLAGEPGPVLLQLGTSALHGGASRPVEAPPSRAPAKLDLSAVGDVVRASRRPLLLVGQGAAGAAAAVTRLAERLHAPVLASTSGRGVVSEEHPLSLVSDVAGGSAESVNALIAAADLVVVVGCRLSHNGSRGFRLVLDADRLVRVDTSREILDRGYPAKWAVEADAADFVSELEGQLGELPSGTGWGDEEIVAWRTRLERDRPARLDPQLGPCSAAELFAVLRRHLPERGIVATDSGLHQYFVRAHFPVLAPRTLLVPTDFQSMGYGVPAAIGGSLATGERAVAVTGDGGFNIVGLELLTAVREQVPLTVFVLVDGYLGLIRLSQLARTGHATGVDVTIPQLDAFAGAIGADYALLDAEGDADAVLQKALASAAVTIVEVPALDPDGLGRLRARGLASAAAKDGRLGQLARRVRRG